MWICQEEIVNGNSYHLTSHQGGLTLHTAGLSSSQLELVDQLIDANTPVEMAIVMNKEDRSAKR